MSDTPDNRKAKEILSSLSQREPVGDLILSRVGRRFYGRFNAATSSRLFEPYDIPDPYQPEAYDPKWAVKLGPVSLRLGRTVGSLRLTSQCESPKSQKTIPMWVLNFGQREYQKPSVRRRQLPSRLPNPPLKRRPQPAHKHKPKPKSIRPFPSQMPMFQSESEATSLQSLACVPVLKNRPPQASQSVQMSFKPLSTKASKFRLIFRHSMKR